MLTVVVLVAVGAVGVVTGLLLRVGFVDTTPERYRKRWKAGPLRAAASGSACFVLAATVTVVALAQGADVWHGGPLLITFTWATAALAVGMPAAWRLVLRDARERRNG